jgi:tetratricopeptide (TPR) repeat protein
MRGKLGWYVLLALIWGVSQPGWAKEGPTDQTQSPTPPGAAIGQAAEIDRQIKELHQQLEAKPEVPPEDTLLQAEDLSRQGYEYHRQQNFALALPYFAKALRLNPAYQPARLMLADTLLSLGRTQEALPYLQQLQGSGFQPGRVAYLSGLAAAQSKQYPQAMEYFKQAEADPKVAQAAKYQMSLILAEEGKLKESRQAMAASVALGPQTHIASVAQNYLQAVDDAMKREAPSPIKINVTTGFDYDFNVTLQPNSEQAAQQVSHKGDLVYNHNLYLEANPLAGKPVEILLQYTYFQNFHRRLPQYDMMSHIVGATPIVNYQQWRFFAPFSFQYNDQASDKYYTAFDLRPTALYMVTPNIGIEGGLILTRNYYWSPVNYAPDNRNGRHIGGSAGAYYFFNNIDGYLQARFSYGYDSTAGDNWDGSAYRWLIAGQMPIYENLKLNSYVLFSWTPYDHRWTNGTADTYPKRDDFNFQFRVDLTYQIYKGFEANFHYYYENNSSNIKLYWYDKSMLGCFLGYKY